MVEVDDLGRRRARRDCLDRGRVPVLSQLPVRARSTQRRPMISTTSFCTALP
jgi:hypothetical protein